MNRNTEAHFAKVPGTEFSRSRFKRDQDIKLTMDAGKLVPFFIDEVLPGDTFRIDQAAIIRQTTPIFPVMDNARISFYYFFVPNRIIWDHWKEFMGENNTSAWTQETEYSVPQLKIMPTIGSGTPPFVPAENTLCDYMGIPTKVYNKEGVGINVNALPFRAYVKIWNEWFRDQNVDNPAILHTDDATQFYQTVTSEETATVDILLQEAEKGGYCLPVNKVHDYFTSCLPAPQKNESAKIPMADAAPVWSYTSFGLNQRTAENSYIDGETRDLAIKFYNSNNDVNKGGTEVQYYDASPSVTATKRNFLGVPLGDYAAATINQLRQAFQVQKLFERDARGGTRYRELVRSHFGVIIDDRTVQVPEYLGGCDVAINISQVVQTSSSTEQQPTGNTGAISVTPMNRSMFTKSFQEHGWVMGVCCVRHDRTYQQGLEKMWSRKSRLDYYFPVFANIGEQAVEKNEIYLAKNVDQTNVTKPPVFGYQEAWAEYRYKPNRVCGKFRSNAEGTLDSWHYADNYSSTPALSQEWMKEGKAEIQRTLAVQDEPQFIMDVLVKNTTTRVMPVYSVPGLIDHH